MIVGSLSINSCVAKWWQKWQTFSCINIYWLKKKQSGSLQNSYFLCLCIRFTPLLLNLLAFCSASPSSMNRRTTSNTIGRSNVPHHGTLSQGVPYGMFQPMEQFVRTYYIMYYLLCNRWQSPEEIVFHDLFVIPNGEDEGQWMNTSDIKQRAGSAALRGGNIALSAILLPIWKAFSSF